MLRLLPPSMRFAGGCILFGGQDLLALSEPAMRRARGGSVGMIFQNPTAALNPLMRIGGQIAESLLAAAGPKPPDMQRRIRELPADVLIADVDRVAAAYPYELSDGQRQRAMIAMAMASQPRLLIADEPTTALDVTTQAQILQLARNTQRRSGAAVLFITHDFGMVAEIADRVVVMQEGRIVETGEARQVLTRPAHPYTQKLVAAVPSLEPPTPRRVAEAPALSCRGVTKTYRRASWLGRAAEATRGVDKVDLTLLKGATVSIVGESGSGRRWHAASCAS